MSNMERTEGGVVMRKVNAIIERAPDGNYSIYMDADDMSYLVTGTGKTEDEAIDTFLKGYEDMKAYYAEQNKPFEEVVFIFTRCLWHSADDKPEKGKWILYKAGMYYTARASENIHLLIDKWCYINDIETDKDGKT